MLDRLAVATMAASSTSLSSISPAVSSASLIRPSIAGQSVPLGCLPSFRNLFEPLDLLLGLFEMAFKPGQIAVGGLIDHLRQRLNDLMLGVIDVLKTVQKQIFHRFDVFRENSHLNLLGIDGISDAERRNLFLYARSRFPGA